MSGAAEHAGLFLSAFLSATLLPGASEAALAAVLALGRSGVWVAVAVATLGNTLGSTVNWAIGRFLARHRGHRLFPVTEAQFARAAAFYRRWGVWSLLLSWVPVIGDPLTVVSGVLGTRLAAFVAIVALAKLGRYLVVAGIVGLF